MLTNLDIMQLRYMKRVGYPLFGGHLSRGQPLPQNSDIRRWIGEGVVEQKGNEGYVLTDAGLVKVAEICHRCNGSGRV